MSKDIREAVDRTNLKLLSVFSGAGGMDVGLESAGFEPIACLEIDEVARATLKLNRPRWPVLEDGDVMQAAKALAPSDFGLHPGELELMAGGPPCQPFSTAGQWVSSGRQGMDDLRAATVHGLLDLFERFRPRVLMLENVQGFVSGPTSALGAIENRVERVNLRYGTQYRLFWRVVDASHFGVPQTRKRAIVFAVDGMKWKWPIGMYLDEPVTAWEAIGDLDEDPSALPKAKGKWASLLPSIPEGSNYQWLTSAGGGEEVFGYRTRYWNFLLKLAKDRPSWTLSASPGPSTGPFHWDNRPLSVRERLRLQSFPDSWLLEGTFREQVKLVGNATPPLLGEVLGMQIASMFGAATKSAPSLLRVNRLPRPSPRPPVPIPLEFRHLIGRKDRHAGHGKGPSPRLDEALASSGSQ